jgi:hypothetical protein
MIQAHLVHPQAAKVLFSSQIMRAFSGVTVCSPGDGGYNSTGRGSESPTDIGKCAVPALASLRNRNVGVGVFPEDEEIFVGSGCPVTSLCS